MPITDFKPYSEKEFADAFQKEVKNGDFRKLLTWHTREGIDVDPFYFSGKSGMQIISQRNDWEINDEISFENSSSGNKLALQRLNEGATSITFISPVKSEADLVTLLKEIGVQYIEINFRNSGNDLGKWLANYCAAQGISTAEIRGSLGYSSFSKEAAVTFPQMQQFTVNGCKFHNAGGTQVQQLGYSIAEGKEVLEQLLDSGATPETAISQIRFAVAIGPDFFFEIAKLRALRLLWKNVTQQYLPGNQLPLFIHAETSRIWLSPDDVNNNLIRVTFQAMSAILGGSDSIFVPSFDSSRQDGFRLSKNVQLVIKEEGFLDKVGDVASGAFYPEQITESLAKAAWKKFQETEKLGGFESQMKNGAIANELSEAALELRTAIAGGKITVIGVNKHRADKSEKVFSIKLEENKDLHKINLFL